MTLGPSLTADDAPSAEAWHEIEAVLDKLAGSAHSAIEPAELHSQLLERLVGLLAAAGGAVWSLDSNGKASVECQLHLDQSLAGDAGELGRHRQMAEAIAHGGQPRLVPPAFRDSHLANATPWLVVLCPVVVEGVPLLVVELFLREGGRSSVEQGYLRLVATACELVEEYHRRRLIGQLREQQGELVGLVDYLARIHEPLDLLATAGAIANEARRLLGVDRVSVLARCGSGVRAIAISGVESFDRRSGVVKAMEPLAASALAVGETLWLPQDSEELPQHIAAAAQTLLDESHARGVGLVPLDAGSEDQRRPVGVLVVEQFAAEFDPPMQQRAVAVARASATALDKALAIDRIPLRRTLTALAAAAGIDRPGWRSPAIVLGVVLAAAALALVLIPAELTVEAQGQLMPVRRQHLFAPSDGIVVDVPLDEGTPVRQGELAARLHSPTLDIEQSELVGRLRTVQEDLLATRTNALRDQAGDDSPASRGQWTAEVLQLEEQLRGLEAQLAIVRQQQAQLELRSPLDGVVITWDPQRQLAGRPVKRGEVLLTVADLSGAWELILDVPDGEAGPLLAARERREPLNVAFQLGTDPGTVRRAKVTSIAPATQLSDRAEPTVRLTAALEPIEAPLRPGASVVARVECGKRSLGYVWLHRIWEGVRLWTFF